MEKRKSRARNFRRLVLKQCAIIVGAVISALAYVLFQLPFQIAAGGLSGLGLIINHYTGWPVGLLFLVMNLPLLVVGYFHLGKVRFLANTVLAVVVFSAAADWFSLYLPKLLEVYPLSDDLLLNAIYAGIIFGLGSGLIYRAGGTVGGTSIPARIVNKYTGYPLSQAYLFTDLFIIILAGFVFNWEVAMLAVLTLVLAGIVADFMLEGVSQVRVAMIITERPKEVSKSLMTELGRGVSLWPVTGAYTDMSRSMLYCTVRRSETFDLRWIVSRIDPEAFLVIGMAQNAWGGKGFSKLKLPESKP